MPAPRVLTRRSRSWRRRRGWPPCSTSMEHETDCERQRWRPVVAFSTPSTCTSTGSTARPGQPRSFGVCILQFPVRAVATRGHRVAIFPTEKPIPLLQAFSFRPLLPMALGVRTDFHHRQQVPGLGHGAFTLVEALVSMLILGIMVTGMASGFMQCHRTAEWSAYSLAAQSLAMQPIEQARAAKWDPTRSIPMDQLVQANFTQRIFSLDVPISGTNIVFATNRTVIRTVSVSPPLREIAVECTWSFPKRGTFTNRVLTFRAPDQ